MKQVFRKIVLGALSSLFVLQACQTPSINTGGSNKYNEKSSFNFKINSQYNDFTAQKTLSIPYTVKNKTDYLITYWLPEGGSGGCVYDTKETTESYNNKYITFWYNNQELKWYVFYDGATYPLSETGGEFIKNNTDGTVLYSGSLLASTQNVTIKIKSKTESFYHWASNYMSGDYKNDVCPRPSNVYYFYDVRETTTTTEFDFVQSFPVIVPTPTPTSTPTSTPTPTPEPTPTEPNSCEASCSSSGAFSTKSISENRSKLENIKHKLKSLGVNNNNGFSIKTIVPFPPTMKLDLLHNMFIDTVNNIASTEKSIDDTKSQLDKNFNSLDQVQNQLSKTDPVKQPAKYNDLLNQKSSLENNINSLSTSLGELLNSLYNLENLLDSIESSLNDYIDSLSQCGCIPPDVFTDYKNDLENYKDKTILKASGKSFSFSVNPGPYTGSYNLTQKSLQHLIGRKHGGDFGVTGNWSNETKIKIEEAIKNHLSNANNKIINGLYRGKDALIIVNPTSHLSVILSKESGKVGELLAGFKLGASQYTNVITHGKLN